MRLLLSLMAVVCLFVSGVVAQPSVGCNGVVFTAGLPVVFGYQMGSTTTFDVPTYCKTWDSFAFVGNCTTHAPGPINANESWLENVEVVVDFHHSNSTFTKGVADTSPDSNYDTANATMSTMSNGHPTTFVVKLWQKKRSFGVDSWVNIATSGEYTVNYTN